MITMDLNVVLIDVKTREVTETAVKMEEDRGVWQIQDVLIEQGHDFEYSAMFFYNQAEEIGLPEALIKDTFNPGDTVVAYIGATAPSESKDLANGRVKISNKSKFKVKVVMKTKLRGSEVYFSDENLNTIDFNKWSNKIEVYWATGNKFENETEYSGNVYELEKTENIWEYRIVDKNKLHDERTNELLELHKIVRGKDPILIPPVKTEKERYERDFLNPKEKSFLFKNTNAAGTESLSVVTGKGRNFVTCAVSSQAEVRIAVKKNRNGSEFGLYTAADVKGSTAKDWECSAMMFDSEAVANVTHFEIGGSSGNFVVSAVTTNGKESMGNKRQKTYRERDRITLKEKIGMALEGAGIVADGAGVAADVADIAFDNI